MKKILNVCALIVAFSMLSVLSVFSGKNKPIERKFSHKEFLQNYSDKDQKYLFDKIMAELEKETRNNKKNNARIAGCAIISALTLPTLALSIVGLITTDIGIGIQRSKAFVPELRKILGQMDEDKQGELESLLYSGKEEKFFNNLKLNVNEILDIFKEYMYGLYFVDRVGLDKKIKDSKDLKVALIIDFLRLPTHGKKGLPLLIRRSIEWKNKATEEGIEKTFTKIEINPHSLKKGGHLIWNPELYKTYLTFEF